VGGAAPVGMTVVASMKRRQKTNIFINYCLRWRVEPTQVERFNRRRHSRTPVRETSRWMIGVANIDGNTEELISAVSSLGYMFVLPQTAIASYLSNLFDRVEETRALEDVFRCVALLEFIQDLLESPATSVEKSAEHVPESLHLIERRLSDYFPDVRRNLLDLLDIKALCEVVGVTAWAMFEPSRWEREA
jgi:hypothetical protein